MVDVKSVIEWYLTLPGTQGVYKAPNGILPVTYYLDGYPFHEYSKGKKKQASIQLRILSPHDIMDVIPIARWFGGDSYDEAAHLAARVHSQFRDLRVKMPGRKDPVVIERTLVSDGCERREESGKSSACSNFPCPEAPLPKKAYEDLSLVIPILSTAKRTNQYAELWEKGEWGGKKHKSKSKAVQKKFLLFSLGESGRRNLAEVDMKDWFIGALHAVLNSQAGFILGCFKAARKRGKGSEFLQRLDVAKVCRNIKPHYGSVKIKFDERGLLKPNILFLLKKDKEMIGNVQNRYLVIFRENGCHLFCI